MLEVNQGDSVPFHGVLVPEYQFRNMATEGLQLKVCEKYLKEKDCGDNFYIKKNGWILAASFVGGAVLASALIYSLTR